MTYCASDLKLPPWKIIIANNEKAELDFSTFTDEEHIGHGTIGVSYGDYMIEGHRHDGPLFDYKSSPADFYGTIKNWTYSPTDKWDHYERTFQKLEMRRPHGWIVLGFTWGVALKYADQQTGWLSAGGFIRKALRLMHRVPIFPATNPYGAAEFIYNECALWVKDNPTKNQ